MKKIIYLLLMLHGGFLMAQTETVVTINGKKVQINPNALSTADNGLTVTSGNIQFGGSLIKPSVLTTSSTNTFAIQGLQAGSVSDQLLTVNANGVVRKKADTSWDINGNAGTSATTNFLGTTDNVDLVFKRNSTFGGRLAATNTSFGVNSMTGTSGGQSVAIGTEALMNNTSYYDTAVGYQALKANTTGQANTAVGRGALTSNTTGGSNIAIGNIALQNNTTGSNNVAIGHQSIGQNIDGSNNTGFGFMTLVSIQTGNNNNTALGASSLQGLSSGSSNVSIGYQCGLTYGSGTNSLTAADNSVLIGYSARPQNNSQTNQVVIGYNAVGRGSNTVQIGNASMTSIGGQVAWSNTSDVRLKKDITTSPYGLNFINKLRPVTYFLKSGPTDLQTGFIAQEVEAAANEINYKFSGIVKPEKAEDFYSLRYSEFVVPLVKAVQEQQQQIEAKEARIQEMENRLQKLEALVQTLTNEKK